MKTKQTETFTLRCGIDNNKPLELHIPACLYPSFEEQMRSEVGRHYMATFFEKYASLSSDERCAFQFFVLEKYRLMLGISDLLPMLNAMCKVIEREKATE